MTIPIVNSRVYTGFSKANPPKTINLPGTTPVKIDTASGNIHESQIVQVTIRASNDFYFTHAENDSNAATYLSNDNTRFYAPAGIWNFDISGMMDEYIYIKSADGSDHAAGLSIAFSERD